MKCTQCKHSLYVRRTTKKYASKANEYTGLCLRCDVLNGIIPVDSTDYACKRKFQCSQYRAESCIDPDAYTVPPDPLSDYFQRALALHNSKKGGKPLTIKVGSKIRL